MTADIGKFCSVIKYFDDDNNDADGGVDKNDNGGDDRDDDEDHDDFLNAWINRNYNTTYKSHG